MSELRPEDLTPEQAERLTGLHDALVGFAGALDACMAAGLMPSDALTAVGVDIPPFAAPMVDGMLTGTVAAVQVGEAN